MNQGSQIDVENRIITPYFTLRYVVRSGFINISNEVGRVKSLLIRSDGVIHVLRRLGGFWKFIAVATSIIPRPLRDVVYDFIMRIRYRIFRRLDNVCPVTPPELRTRFDE